MSGYSKNSAVSWEPSLQMDPPRKSAVQLTFWGGTPLDFSNRIHVIHIIRHITMWPLLLRPCVIGSILVRMVDLDAGHQKVVG